VRVDNATGGGGGPVLCGCQGGPLEWTFSTEGQGRVCDVALGKRLVGPVIHEMGRGRFEEGLGRKLGRLGQGVLSGSRPL